MPETRPRIWFDEKGVCSACLWTEEKKKINWSERWEQLENLCRDSKTNGNFSCIVPVSGGKDSSYVAYMMKHKMKTNPLCITITPGLPLGIGQKNLRNFVNAGYDLLQVDVNPKVLAAIDKVGLVEYGRPMLGWMTAVQTVIFKMAVLHKIPLVMFGEEGETEYGGSSKLRNSAFYDVEDSINLYLSGANPQQYRNILTEDELLWFNYPSKEELRSLNIKIAHFSHFENWDPYHHYLISKEFCGLQECEERVQGTYNNFAQTDTILYNLHVYFMYLKFGFGRCTQDVGIDIRRGALSRKQGLTLVRTYDREEPEMYIPQYLDYYKMTRSEFDSVVDRHVNKDLFEKINNKWEPVFEIE
jgi:N-acetyl sugar amidotransferase